MPVYAHTETGCALDVWPNDTKEEYSARFLEVPGFDTWQIVTVPDGTRHGDLDNRDGTFTRPPIHTPPAESKILSKINFQDYAVSQLGGSVTGMARFQTIIDSCEKSNLPSRQQRLRR